MPGTPSWELDPGPPPAAAVGLLSLPPLLRLLLFLRPPELQKRSLCMQGQASAGLEDQLLAAHDSRAPPCCHFGHPLSITELMVLVLPKHTRKHGFTRPLQADQQLHT